MTVEQFIRKRQSDWERLERLLSKARGGRVTRLSEQELRDLGQLYRAAVSDLALARRDFQRHEITASLNALVGRAHHLVYRGARVEQGRIRDFLKHGFPRLYQRNRRYIGVAALLLFIPWLLAWWATFNSPELAYFLAPEARQSLQRVEDRGQLWIDISAEESPKAGSMIMTRNIQVSIMAFAGGALAGIGTILILFLNGIFLGTMMGFVQSHGLGPELWEFIIAHGPVELTVISIAGGAGLRLGYSMVAPGMMRRRDAIVEAAREAIGLVLGGALLLVGAGLIEGFISPSFLPWYIKAAVGVTTGTLAFVYLRGNIFPESTSYRSNRGNGASRQEALASSGPRGNGDGTARQ